MSKVVKAVFKPVEKLLGMDAPKVSTAAERSLAADAEQAKKSRAALYATEAGAAGEELSEGSTTRRRTLLGN